MDVKLINPVLETVLNVLGTMANIRPDVGKPMLKQDAVALGEVTGIMDMISPQVRASLAISFSKPVIIEIVRSMLGEEIDSIDGTAKDMTGELANMVVGGAKNLYAAQGYDFSMSSPEVLQGESHTIRHACTGKTLLLPLSLAAGDFYLELCFEEI